MEKKGLIAIAVTVVIVLALAGMSAMQRKNRNEESSVAESSAVTTDIIIVPAEMPSRISFQTPPGFTETSSAYYDKYYVLNDASVIVTGEELTIGGTVLDEYVEDVKAQYEKTADEYKLLSDDEIKLKGDLPCRVLQFTYAIVAADAKQEMECITAVIIQDDFVYIVTCKSKKETFNTYRAAFLQMIESIEIEEVTPPEATTAAAPQSPQ